MRLCAEALLACYVDELIKFWARRAPSLTFMPCEADVQSRVWRCCTHGRPVRVSGLICICVTSLIHFISKSHTWELNNGNFKIYDDLLRHSMDRARDGDIDSVCFLDRVAEVVARTSCPRFRPSHALLISSLPNAKWRMQDSSYPISSSSSTTC